MNEPREESSSDAFCPLNGSILVVDDNRVNRQILAQLLKKNGHRVETAENGKEALEIIAHQQFDLILLDILMPEIDGFQVLEQLKASPIYRHIPVLVISGLEDIDNIVRCIEMGAEDYLLKPFNPAILKARISACLEKKRLHDELAFTFQEVSRQRDSIEEKNRQILDSIHYARRIQKAILPQPAMLDHYLKNYFLIFQPKDIVSGDFFWMYVRPSTPTPQIFVAVADCTGHGVPGAFMSMIGTTLLNQIIGDEGILEPAQILNRLHIGVQKILNQNEQDSETQDGMEICLCKIEGYSVTFAGANRPLYLVNQTETGDLKVEEIKGDRKPIGGRELNLPRVFTNCEISVGDGTRLFLTTDGYADQAGPDRGRIGTKHLKKFLMETSAFTIGDQKSALTNFLVEYQAGEPQRDDTTILGLELPLTPTETDSGEVKPFALTWNINL
ncbi:MAG: response regulator [Acidobacteria bacterium]|nr:response regulator [Acidobacteriota bacterium]